MQEEMQNCPNCQTQIKGGFLSSVALLSENKTNIINEYHDKAVDGFCTKCGTALYEKYKLEVNKEREELAAQIEEYIDSLPIVSTHSPLNWDYDILSIVTGHTTTGAGAITEFTSSFANFFGTQSGGYNQKLKASEGLCFAQLRKQTLDLGGNAIIAASMTYSEVSEKGMLMVCATGTAIKLKNFSVLGAERSENIVALTQLNKRIEVLSWFDTTEN